MNELMNFSNQILSREEMSSVKGGTRYSCECASGAGCNVGQWTGNYSSLGQMVESVNNYCSCGGGCDNIE